MQIKTSYFYQIRFFTPNMIPVSTALGDPDWYHEGLGKDHLFLDKRRIINGIRYNYIMAQRNCGGCPCKLKDPDHCDFLTNYREEINKLDFDKVIADLTWLGNTLKHKLRFKEEPIIVLMVHEAWYNACSERKILQDFFNSHGVNCEELTYPLNKCQK